MRVIVFECARARPCRLCLSFWVGLRAHTHTHSVHAREHMPVFETVVLTMLSNTLEDKARRQPAYCHSAGYKSSMRFACRHPRGQGAPPARVALPFSVQRVAVLYSAGAPAPSTLVTHHPCGSRVDTLEDKAPRQPACCRSVFSGLACAQRAGCTGQHALQHSRGFVPAVRRALCCQPATHRPRPLALCFLGFRRSSICGLVRARVPGENDRCEFLLALLALFLRALSPGRTPRAKV